MDRTRIVLQAGLVAATCLTLSACGGGGGGGGGGTTPPPGGNVTVSGTVTFERPSYRSNNTLDFANLQRLPVRGATVEILRSSDQSVLATTTTDATAGNYSASVANTPIIVRVKARLAKPGTAGYDFEVRNNTSGNALYALDSSVVTPTGSTARIDLNAATGWSGTSYTGTRAAAPFAILDMLWQAKELLQGAEANLTMPAVDVFWSTLNNSADCDGRPDPASGAIGTTFYVGGTIAATANCSATTAGIYVLGDASGNADDDADEFDPSVIAHEFGHYFEDAFSRGDSLGGPHSLDSRHDLTLAMSEGWGNAFQGFVLNNKWYRDTFGTSGSLVFAFDMENDTSPYLVETGWFAEASIQEFLWDVYDGVGDDQIDLGYGPIHTVMRNDMRTTDALTSIYVMANGLETRNPSTQAAIRSRLQAERIFGEGDFGVGETPVLRNTSTGWPADPDAVPVFEPVTFGVPVSTVSTIQFADPGDTFYQAYNRLGGRRYLRIDLPSGGFLRIRAQGPVGSDPDFSLYRNAVDQCPSGGACSGFDFSTSDGLEEATYSGLAAGTYVLDVAECSNLGEVVCGADSTARGDTPIVVTVTQQ
jgi:hypothetical protein